MDWKEIEVRRNYAEKKILKYIENKTGLDVYQNYIPDTFTSNDPCYDDVQNYESTKLLKRVKNKYIFDNLLNGDLLIDWGNITKRNNNIYKRKNIPEDSEYIKVDVRVGTFMSDTSIENFKGNFYILIPEGDIDDIGNVRVISRRTIKSYYNTCGPRLDKFTNSMGLRLKKRLRNECSLDEFCLRLINAKLCNMPIIEIDDYNNKIFNPGANA